MWRASVCDIAGGADAARELESQLGAAKWAGERTSPVERAMNDYVTKIAFDPQDHSQRAGLVLLLLIDGAEEHPWFVLGLRELHPNGFARRTLKTRWGAFGSEAMKVEVRVAVLAESSKGLPDGWEGGDPLHTFIFNRDG